MSSENKNFPRHVLLQHLEDIAKNEGFLEYEIEEKACSTVGDGFMSTMLNIILVGRKLINGNATRLSLVCKIQPENAARQEEFRSAATFEREVFVYKTLLPTLEKLQREHGLTEATGFFQYPKCYVAVFNANESIIIMEDLRANGYALWDKVKPATFESVKLLLEQLGRYHGLSFVLRDQQPHTFHEFMKKRTIIPKLHSSATIKSIFETCYNRAKSLMSLDTDIKLMQRFKDSFAEIVIEMTKPEEPFAVLIHGDCWNSNMMYLCQNVST